MEERGWKRVLVLGIGLAGIAALFLTAILIVGSPIRQTDRDTVREEAAGDAGRGEATKPSAPDEPRIPTGEEALRQDARWYAKDMDVSLDEAIRRLRMQDDRLPTELERELKKSEGDTFAGLWLRHRPDYGLTVATSGDPETMMRKIEPIVAGTRWEGTINVKRVGATEAQLEAARAEAEGMLDRLGITYDSGDNIMKNRMEVYVRNKARVERRLRAAGLEFPEHVVLMEGVARPA